MAWEVYRPERNTLGEPAVTLSPTGRMVFNKAATKKLHDLKLRRAELLWDPARALIGVRPSSSPSASYSLRIPESMNNTSFSCSSFMNHIGYDWSKTRSFPASWDEKQKMYVIEVPKENLGHKPLNRRDLFAERSAGKRTKEAPEGTS
jgi:hypothetical protein